MTDADDKLEATKKMILELTATSLKAIASDLYGVSPEDM